MSDLGKNALFQELLLAHAKGPRGAGRLAPAPDVAHVHAVNALCGDELWLDVRRGASVTGAFESKGCALCRASASILLGALADADLAPAAALALAAAFRQAFTAAGPSAGVGGSGSGPRTEGRLWPGDVAALFDLRAFPSRRRCVLLAWEALTEALSSPSAGVDSRP